MHFMQVLKIISLGLGTFIGLYGLYLVIIGLNFFRKERSYKKAN